MSSFADDLASLDQSPETQVARGSFAADLAALTAEPRSRPAPGSFAADLAALDGAPDRGRLRFSPLEADVISSSPAAMFRAAPSAAETFKLEPSAPIGSDIALPKDAPRPPLRPGRMAGLADTAPRSTTTTPQDILGGVMAAPIGALQALPAAAGEQLAHTSLPGHENEPSSVIGRTWQHLKMTAAGRGGDVVPQAAVTEAIVGNPAERSVMPAPAGGDLLSHGPSSMPVNPKVQELARRGLGTAAKMLMDPALVAIGAAPSSVAEALSVVFAHQGVEAAVHTATDPRASDVDVAESVINALLMALPVGAQALRQIRTRVGAIAEAARAVPEEAHGEASPPPPDEGAAMPGIVATQGVKPAPPVLDAEAQAIRDQTAAPSTAAVGRTFAEDLASLDRPSPSPVASSSFADDLAALRTRPLDPSAPQAADIVAPQTSAADVLDTGELQPRLPEAGAVRNREATAAPVADVPFSLEREVHEAPTVQPALREEPSAAAPVEGKPKNEPRSVRAPAVEWDALTPQHQREVRRILLEMEDFKHEGKQFNETTRRGGDLEVTRGRLAGAPVYWDIVGGNPEGRPTFSYSRKDVAQKLRAFVEQGKRSVVSDLAVDVAERRIAGDRSLAESWAHPEAGDEPGAVRVTRRSTFVDRDKADVQRRAIAAVENNTDALAQAYREKFDNVVSADNAKELFPDYATKAQRTANDLAVHRPASRLAQHLYDEALKEPVAEGHDPFVVLTAGGTGSGKTSSLDVIMKKIEDHAHVIYDSTLSDLDAARANIEAAKAAGHEVLVAFTDRELQEAFGATLGRARESGRPVTINTHVATHLKAPEVFDALRKEYAGDPAVSLAVIRNSAEGRELVPASQWEPRRYNEADVRARLSRTLDAERARLGEPLYDAVRGAAEKPAAAAGDEGIGGGHRDLQPNAAPGRHAEDPTEVDAAAPRKPAMPRGRGITLEATVLPGARQFAEQDLAPALHGAAEMGRDIKHTLSPPSASPDAQGTADTVRRAKATIANAAAIESSKYGHSEGRLASALRGAFGVQTQRFATVTKHFSKFSDAENIANITAYERTGRFAHAPAGYSEFYNTSMTDARALLQQAYGEDRVGLVENYVRRAFVFGSKADEAKGTAYLSSPRSSLSANKSPIKGRILDMPLEEALATMKARGISVKLAVTNPELLRQWSVSNARQAVAYADAWRQLKDADRIAFVKPGGRVPEGAIPLDDRAARVFFPTDKGLVQAGSYYADPAVARVLNNTISQGLGGSPTFRGVRAMNNALNQLQLGVSGFHFTGVAINAGVSDLALGLRQMARGATSGDVGVLGRGTARAAGSLVPFQSFARDLYHGRALVEGLKNGSPDAAGFLEEKLNPAGGRLRIDARYRNQAYDNLVRAFHNDNYIGAALRLPLALIEQTAKPLMEYAIPRVKLGAFMDLARDITNRMPDATPAELHRAYAQAWDSIDNRFGQLVYDNLFWNKTAQDLAQVATRSVGWNLGTVREIGGGLADVATQTVRGRGVSDRALYTAALPLYVGLIGAAYQYLKTGDGPSELKDYFYPKNGRTEPNGMASRTTLPTYMKDVYAYSSHPIDTAAHKQSPLLELAGELAKNEDFFGTMIRNPEDPAMQQLQQVGAHVLRGAQPFSLQQFQRTTEEGGGAEAHTESFFGFTKASASVERSPAETLLHDYLGPTTRRTPEQRDRGTVKADLRAAVKAGDGEKARAIAEQGQLTRRQLQNAARTARLTGFQAGFQRLGLEQALNVYEVASPAERGLLAPLLDGKVRRADDTTIAPADVDRVKAKVMKAMSLPRADPKPAPPAAPSVTRLAMPPGRPQTRPMPPRRAGDDAAVRP